MDKNKTEKYGAPDNPYAYTVLQNYRMPDVQMNGRGIYGSSGE